MTILRFEAMQCDERYSKNFRTFTNIEEIGTGVNIEITTDADITNEYILKMEKEIENLPVADHKYFRNVKYYGSTLN